MATTYGTEREGAHWLARAIRAAELGNRGDFAFALEALEDTLRDGLAPPTCTPAMMGTAREGIHCNYGFKAFRTKARTWLGNERHAIMSAVPQDPESGFVFVVYNRAGDELARWALGK